MARLSRVSALAALALAGPLAAQDGLGPEHYGRRLIDKTYAVIGPEVADPAMRVSGNNLACSSCHIAGGIRPGGLPLVATVDSYPEHVARSGRVETIEDRVNDCMLRSMNGRALDEASPEMAAIVVYFETLAREHPDFDPVGPGQAPLAELDRAADPVRGANLYATQCAACHGLDGAGQRNGAAGDALGYRYPPLWGPDSFNDGAGMARLIGAANFVHDDMPASAVAGPPELTAETAWDVAAYVISRPRPQMAGLERDYPDLLKKPVDTPYGPYADGFSAEQHRFGPFAPIRARLDALAAAN